MASGMAIMGFGGGAMIGSPLADRLMRYFAGPDSVGVWQTFLVLAAIYFVFMMLGSFAYRVPPDGWAPSGWAPSDRDGKPSATPSASPTLAGTHAATESMTVGQAWQTRQFWLLWLVLCLNVSAGIGVIGMASPMLQEVFGGRLLGENISFEQLDAAQLGRVAAMGAGFTGLLSLFNILGRFFWSSLSDTLGRKTTYCLFFLLGAALYAAVPGVGRAGNIPLFCGIFCLILTMYGGGFAAIPAYLADLFGTGNVGAIHGRLLTAWSVAGILGPVLVNYFNAYQIRAGMPRSRAYDQTMLLLAGLLVAGFFCNLLVRPVHKPQPRDDDDTGSASSSARLPAAPYRSGPWEQSPTASAAGAAHDGSGSWLVLFWLLVAVPMAWGVWMTLRQAWALFG
jgi:MFS family permease